ncbi:MAG: polysaccharide biosynthesis C-terminal domain-containing protein [Clostridia bacterium]|nr:polysaccharide biosynthesis C-terminal domain-containing protein [Clostridia bacterium]
MNEKLDMSKGAIWVQMIRFVIPIILLGFLQQFFNVADVILAGRLGTSGDSAVAAVGSTNSIRILLVNFFSGCATGSAVAISHAIGSKDKKAIKQNVHTAMLLSVIIGVIVTVVGMTLSGALLTAMGTPSDILGKSTIYLQTYFLTMIPATIYNFGAGILRANGETKKPFYFFLVTAPVKLIMTYVFVALFDLDLIGLSLATVCSQTLAAILVVMALMRRDDDIKLSLKDLKIYKEPLGKILRLGIPAGIQSSTFSLSNVVIQSSINSLANLPGFITGNAAASSIEAFAEVVTGGFLSTAMTFVGYNVGAKNYDKVKRSYNTSLILCTITVAALSAFVVIFAKPLLGLYITESEEAIAWGVVRIAFIFGPLIIQGVMDTTSGALSGLGISVSNAIIALVGFCGLRIVWCLTVFQVEEYHTPQTLYIIYPITWVIIAILRYVLFWVVYKHQKKKLYQE